MDYCISDIHGYYSLFCRLLDKIGFGADDRLFVLGDMIDKGPDSVRLIKLVFSMSNAFCIMGNHEYDFVKYYRALMQSSRDYDRVLDALKDWFSDGGLLDWQTMDKLETLPFYVETDKFTGVHAGIPLINGTPLPVGGAAPGQLVYDRHFKEKSVLPAGDKCIVFGHTPVRYISGNDNILLYPRRGTVKIGDLSDCCKAHIDTGVSLSGILGCIAADTCETFYVSLR